MAACHDREGWRPVSRLRDFDLTPCFEEAAVLAGLLAAVFLLAVLRTIAICLREPLHLSRKSTLYLRTKLVRVMLCFRILLTSETGLAYYFSPHQHRQRYSYRALT